MFSVLLVRRHPSSRSVTRPMSPSRRLLIGIALLLSVSACSKAVPSPTATATPPTPQETVAPSVVPSSTVTTAPTVVLDSTPVPGKGNVTGLIIRAPMGVDPHPMRDTKLYLAEMLRNAQGDLDGLAGVDEEQAPFAWTDTEGQFAFRDVEPGHYALIIKHPLSLILAHDELTARDIVVEVTADQIQDIGSIQVNITE